MSKLNMKEEVGIVKGLVVPDEVCASKLFGYLPILVLKQ